MGTITGSVLRVQQLEKRSESDSLLFSVSIEGIGFLARPELVQNNGSSIAAGQIVKLAFSTYWPKKGNRRPRFFARSIVPLE